MKKRMLLGILLSVLLVAGNSFADPMIKVTGELPNSTLGGPFTITGDLGNFSTFCLESTETLVIGGTYAVSISNTVVGGGAGGQQPPPIGTNALSYTAAYLYLEWLGLSAADKTNSSINDAFQNAIWYAEGEGGIANQKYTDAHNAVATWTDYHGVVVLNLHTGTTNNQSLLGLDPVPEPATMVLLGLGLIGLAGFGRKKLA